MDFPALPAKRPIVRKSLLFAGTAALLIAGGVGIVRAQLEGSDRGIPPLDSTSNFEVTGVQVDVNGKDASEARQNGWKLAQRLGWRKLWARTTGRPENQAPAVNDAVLNQIVSGIIVEDEQLGPTRYVARLGLLFDRARTGEMLGVSGIVRRSAPMLVIPVMRTGSTGYALEFRSPWQNAWAQFRTSQSVIDYVRPVGTGVDPLLLNAAQTGRRSRGWWRTLLDQYNASDVVMPEMQLRRAWPGGPAIARFVARYGPDGDILGTFELRADGTEQIPQMLSEGVQRMDALYTQAFNAGLLRPNPTLITPREFRPAPPPPPPAELIADDNEPLPTQDGGVVVPTLPPEGQVQEVPAPTPRPPSAPDAPPGFGPRRP